MHRVLRPLIASWQCRWGVLRLTLAAFALWVLIADTDARRARLELAALPDFDFVREVAALREAGRYGEAIDIADAGLAQDPPLSPDIRARLETERATTETARSSWTRRGTDALKGVALGTGDADASLERVIGAVGADFFLIGDVRDLAIQSWRYISGGETDGVIAALSAIGLVTTVAPEIDWAPSILKAARRAGSLSGRLGGFIVRAVRARDVGTIRALVADTASIARITSPATTSRLLRLADEPADVARLARFVEHEGPAGAFVLRSTGRDGRRVLSAVDDLTLADDAAGAARAQRALFAAARKGDAGAVWLRRGLWRPLVRPHPLVGAAKALWSGHAADLVERALQRLDPAAWWAIPALFAWIALELGLIGMRVRRAAWPRAPKGHPSQSPGRIPGLPVTTTGKP